MEKREPGGVGRMTQGTQSCCSVPTWKGGMGREVWGGVQDGEGHTYVCGRFISSAISVAQSSQTLCSPWTAAGQASPSITNSWTLLKLMSLESVMSSNHLIFCRPLLLPPFPASGSFLMSHFLASGGQRTGASASVSVLPMNIHIDVWQKPSQ